MCLRAALVVAVLVARLGPAHADDLAEARAHFTKGSNAFDLGAYDEAVTEYEAAYRFKNDPTLLYNIAQALRLAGRSADALRFYRVYLSRMPRASNEAEVKAKIAELQKLVEQQGRTQQMPPDHSIPLGASPNASSSEESRPHPAEPKTPPLDRSSNSQRQESAKVMVPSTATTSPKPETLAPKPAATATSRPRVVRSGAGRSKKIAGAVIGSVGIAAIATAIAFGILAQQAGDDLTRLNNVMATFDPAKQSDGKSAQVIEGVMLGVGVAALAAGATVFLLGLRESRAPRPSRFAFVPLISPTMSGAAVRIGF